MTPEGRVKADIKKWLKEQGAYFFMPVQTGYGAATLDFLCCFHGQFVAIEAKAPKTGRISKRQEIIAEEIEAARGFVIVATSVAEVKAGFSEYGLI